LSASLDAIRPLDRPRALPPSERLSSPDFPLRFPVVSCPIALPGALEGSWLLVAATVEPVVASQPNTCPG
jgi:hypothetical protein